MSLVYITQQITIYGGVLLFFTGIIGNGMNIWIFLSVRTYRNTPCTFYFLIESICNWFYIMINMTIRIITAIYGIDLTLSSIAWCKLHGYIVGVLGIISFTCSCLAAIDQFFITSRSVKLRRCSNIKWAHRIVFIVISFWCLHGIPALVLYDISPITGRCDNINANFNIYLLVYAVGYMCICPIVIMIVFGYLACRNIQLTRVLAEQHADRQMTRMTLIQVVLVVISMTPFGVFILYSINTEGIAKGLNQLMIENLLFTIILLISYTYHVGNFYMFLISSNRFRETVKDRIFCWRKPRHIFPLQQSTQRRTT